MTDDEVMVEAYRLWRLPVMRQQPRWSKTLPLIELRRGRAWYSSGRCWGTGGRARILLTVGKDDACVRVTLLHELVHACQSSGTAHAERFLDCASFGSTCSVA